MPITSKFTKASFALVLRVLLIIEQFLFLYSQCLSCSSDVKPGLFVVRVVLVDKVPAAIADLLIWMPKPVLPSHIGASFISKQTCFALNLVTGIVELHNRFLSLQGCNLVAFFFLLHGRLLFACSIQKSLSIRENLWLGKFGKIRRMGKWKKAKVTYNEASESYPSSERSFLTFCSSFFRLKSSNLFKALLEFRSLIC